MPNIVERSSDNRSIPPGLGGCAFLASAALFFLLPLYVMLATSLKSMDEIRLGSIFALPLAPTLDAWRAAWSEATVSAPPPAPCCSRSA